MSEAFPTGGSDFGAPCATAVRATMRMALLDYRLHPQVKAACEPTLPRVCPTVPPGEGAVLRCLLDGEGSGNLTDKARTVAERLPTYAIENCAAWRAQARSGNLFSRRSTN